MTTVKELKDYIIEIRKKFPQESRNFEPWVDEFLNTDDSLNDNYVYNEWGTPMMLNDGTLMPHLLTYEILQRKRLKDEESNH